ncbi:MAG: 2-oxoglutarate dehydrogenase complex dihydrolipoyllysine-residue succinyltransferase [Planctomycetota bacterium]|nr:2-oxoglutarate dehydrogenase complex dihydrolipoyllysine-residue succinyltransferase [Planctomycetota bacterium]
MAVDIVIPAMGESVSEGVIGKWLKSDGEAVERDEIVLELETDKIAMEVPAPAGGVLHTSRKEGDTVGVGDVVGSVDESGAPAKKAEAPEKKSASKQQGGQSGADKKQPAPSGAATAEAEPSRNGPAADADHDARATPLARKIAAEKGVDLSKVTPTGAGGRIREQDVLGYVQSSSTTTARGAAAAPPAPAQAPTGDREVRRERMSPLRQRIAERLVEAQHTAAMLTTFNECDMTAVMDLRSRYKDNFEKQHGVKLGFMSFFVKAAVNALQAYPRVNAWIVQGSNGPEIEYHDYCDIAVAVSTPRGLVVPVVRNCQNLSFADVEKNINDVAARARDNKITLEEMQGGTFTITNGGIYGSMMSTPILNPPQSGILGMHNIVRRPVENPDKPGEVAIRPMMYIALSYDHRIVDGAEAVGCLKRIKECIEDPQRMLVGI